MIKIFSEETYCKKDARNSLKNLQAAVNAFIIHGGKHRKCNLHLEQSIVEDYSYLIVVVEYKEENKNE